METTRLHYIYDPFCGWCYASAPLMAAARHLLPVTAHGGGMMAGSNRQPVTDRLRNYVMPHDRRIAAMTGQPFGQAYFDGLLRDHDAVFDSEPPITAILAALDAGGEGRDLDLLARLQRAHYVEGRRIADAGVLTEMAADIGLDRPAFEAAYAARKGQPTRDHIAESRALLAHAGGQGFPTFALERNGRYRLLDTGRYLGRVDEWRAALAGLID
ncbi:MULTISPECIES: DsbA family protein [Pigmentiphaga]|uniref:Disulfide reductase DsbM n=1 Tax=Pigmentiphaga daeguensis TaxID=414049 RepID=A0ABN1BWN8_9BURK|nr:MULTISPECIES: protein-disulfide isomerase [unclassified Pigmentiphaga]OVZ62689.1 protein-disulfide isomerase [Pigmentiphaga sp. NML030171]